MSRQPLNTAFSQTSFLQGANAAYIEQMQAAYERNPGSVNDEWRLFFQSLNEDVGAAEAEATGASWQVPLERLSQIDNPDLMGALTGDYAGVAEHVQQRMLAKVHGQGADLSVMASLRATQDSIRALMLIRAYRVMGHLAADLDPLGLAEERDHRELHPETYGFTEADFDRPIFIDSVLGLETATIRQIVRILRRTYCRSVGVEFMHITTPQQKAWIQERIEGEEKDINFTVEGKRAILNKLIEAEAFEKFSDVKYTGTKRFGLEGGESMVPALEQIIKRGGQMGVREIVFGMAHRGRLNVLANVMGKPHRAIFNEFKGGSFKPDDVEGSGDVKYHLGASSDRAFDGNNVHLSLTANPSHLEIVDPVVLGKVRAKQDQHGDKERRAVLPLLIHGDAAFAGQGVVAECFGLSGLKGHRTGGSIHFVINNQIGFTTNPRFSRSAPYCSDVARMIEAPIFHVNGDDPEAVVHVAKVATEFRQTFGKPVVIDMFCYRRHGHNESDEPAFTQPIMYRKIKSHPTTVEIYSKQLIDEGVMTAGEFDEMKGAFRAHLDSELEASDGFRPNKADWLDGKWSGIGFAEDEARRGNTGVDLDILKDVGRRITAVPKDFKVHRTVARLLERRRGMIDAGEGIDWAMAEHLALGTLLREQFPVRLSGQDVERGTFSQRHCVLIDQDDEQRYIPLDRVAPDQANFEVINSMLSEEAVLGFEYGYALSEPNCLTIWEAQFGDFANGAQVVIDQFISSGEQKWGRMCGLTMLLPHGYEGQGPEHSSARLERYLQLCAEQNMQVMVPSTPAQVYHMLRQQVLRPMRRPLIVMSPKSLLRHPLCISTMDELANGTFQAAIDEVDALDPTQVKRVVFCSGKVYYDLLEQRRKNEQTDVAIIRIEQLYPFPLELVRELLAPYAHVTDYVWCQEEPQNQGAWYCSQHNFYAAIPAGAKLTYAGRPASASPAVGYMSVHLKQQKALVEDALTVEQKEL